MFAGFAPIGRAAWLQAILLVLWSASGSVAAQPAPASSQAPKGREPSVLSWPEPPARARISFVRVLTPATAGAKPSGLSRFFRLLTGGASTRPEISQPYGIAADGSGRLYVADTYAGTIHVFDLRRTRYSAIHLDARALIGVAVLGDNLVVTDSEGQRVLCVTAKGKTVWSLDEKDGFERPTGLVAAGDRVHVVDTLGARVVTVSDKGKVVGSFGTRGAGPGEFNFPTSIARAADGRLFVSDSMNFRVQVFDAGGRHQATFGQLGDGSGDFNKPKGIAVDSDGHVYVVEGLHDAVQIFDDTGRFLLAFGESGAGDGQFWLPTGIAIQDDVVYVADAANRRVQVFKYLKEQP